MTKINLNYIIDHRSGNWRHECELRYVLSSDGRVANELTLRTNPAQSPETFGLVGHVGDFVGSSSLWTRSCDRFARTKYLNLCITFINLKSSLFDRISNLKTHASSIVAGGAHHSTESTFLSVHDHIIKAMAQQKITALCLLDLSAAFDTIDHSILIHRLSSRFGLNGTVLSWLNS